VPCCIWHADTSGTLFLDTFGASFLSLLPIEWLL